jgi:hypothetical protein
MSLQHVIKKIQKYCQLIKTKLTRETGLEVNTEKTKYIVLSHHQKVKVKLSLCFN